MGILIEGVFAFFFLLVLEGLAFWKGLQSQISLKDRWDIHSLGTTFLKFLTRSLMSNHHDLNLGKGNPFLVGEVKGITELDTNILMRFSFLKAREATTGGKAKVERCPSVPWSKPSWWANLWGF